MKKRKEYAALFFDLLQDKKQEIKPEHHNPTINIQTELFQSVCLCMCTYEQQGEDDDQLVHSMAQDVLHHGQRDERVVPAIRFP